MVVGDCPGYRDNRHPILKIANMVNMVIVMMMIIVMIVIMVMAIVDIIIIMGRAEPVYRP